MFWGIKKAGKWEIPRPDAVDVLVGDVVESSRTWVKLMLLDRATTSFVGVSALAMFLIGRLLATWWLLVFLCKGKNG